MKLDCIVIGGGPAGLTAAVYLARFRRSVRVLDAQSSRAALIPRSHNYPGFPEGVTGDDLLDRLRRQAVCYGAEIVTCAVERIEPVTADTLVVWSSEGCATAASVIIATGVVDVEPALPNLTDAIRTGLVRHCPVCDGFEVIDQVVAVIGTGRKGMREALFIRQFTACITLFTLGPDPELDVDDRFALAAAGIDVVEQPIAEVEREGHALVGLRTADGRSYRFHSLYSALGARPRCELAGALGVKLSAADLIVVDDRQRTSVPGVYACGDIVDDALNQICVGAGHAATAATAIHNALPPGWAARA